MNSREGKKKGQGKNLGLIFNYLAFAAFFGAVSAVTWIANFGVVPLFFISAFLALPAFLTFLALLFSVTHVLETIGQLLYYNRYYRNGIKSVINFNFYKQIFKPSFLPTFIYCVKAFFVTSSVIWCLSYQKTANATDIILSRGQTHSLPIENLNKFNVSNKEVIKYKFDEKAKKIMLRGKSMGYSELLIWEKGQETPKSYQVYVISKRSESNLMSHAQFLQSLGFTTSIQLPQIVVSGNIQDLFTYTKFKQLKETEAGLIIDETTIHNELKKQILSDVLKTLLEEFNDTTKCAFNDNQLLCKYPANHAPAKNIINHLKRKYHAEFLESDSQRLTQNYSFKLKLLQVEQLDGEEIRFGLEQLNTNLTELLTLPLKNILDKNAVLLGQKNVEINTLAEPSGIIRAKSPAEFQIGAEIPYSQISTNGASQTQWQFAGLKLKVVLENIGHQLKIDYEAELTKPGLEGSISGNKEKSSVILDLGKGVKLFQITLRTDSEGVDKMPYLNRIPILGELFKSKSRQNNFKIITGIIEVKHYE